MKRKGKKARDKRADIHIKGVTLKPGDAEKLFPYLMESLRSLKRHA